MALHGAIHSQPLPPTDYDEANMVIWGPPMEETMSIKMMWWEQLLEFMPLPQLEQQQQQQQQGRRGSGWAFGIDQPRNGPCGLLAAIEAMCVCVILSLLKEGGGKEKEKEVKRLLLFPTQEEREVVLAHSLALILTRAQPHATIHDIFPPPSLSSSSSFPPSPPDFSVKVILSGQAGTGEDCSFHIFDASLLHFHSPPSFSSLFSLFRAHLRHFQTNGGLLLFLLSLVLTTGSNCVREDMEYGTLVSDGLGFCTQALVNLLLGGQATFDIGGKTTTRHNVYRQPKNNTPSPSPSSLPSLIPSLIPSRPATTHQVEEIITRTKDHITGKTLYECLCHPSQDPSHTLFPQPVPFTPPSPNIAAAPPTPTIQKWRCASCTRKEPRVWSARNPSSSSTCQECHNHFSQTSWCLLLSYPELPPHIQQEADMIYGPPSPTPTPASLPTPSLPPPTTTTTTLRQSDIGFLASSEVVGAHLRKPRFPVWILYSGSHYTVVFGVSLFLLEDPSPSSSLGVDMFHFNGLPPGGPFLRSFEMVFGGGERKEEGGGGGGGNGSGELIQVSEVVTRSKDGRFYEVVCEESDFLSKKHPSFGRGVGEGERWRCLKCTHERPRVWRAVNEVGERKCKECGGEREVVGWCPWLLHEELPLVMRKEVDDRYSEAITQIMRTRWKEANCLFREGEVPPCL